MLERTIVFVDTSYLLASFYNSWETGARAQLEIDLPEVVATLDNMIVNQLDNSVHRQYWYDGIPDSGPHRYQRALRTCNGVQLRTGQLIEWGERRAQKAVDTRLVADMVVSAMRAQVTDFVLVSGDADMIPGVEEAVDNGVRVHLYGFGWDSMSSALRHACDTTTILDPREDFADCMELQVLEGPVPPIVPEHIASQEPVSETDSEEASEVEAAFAAETEAEARVEAQIEVEAEISGAVSEPSAAPAPSPADLAAGRTDAQPDGTGFPLESEAADPAEESTSTEEGPGEEKSAAPKPSMMAPRRKLRSKYVPLPEEVWSSAGFQSPFDVGQQYASWWFENAANAEQRDQAHLLSGGGLPPEIDRPLLQFACETLHEYTLTESQRVNLRDGFHSGIRGVLINVHREL
ncbi:NYN domain-containing protein [Corynebacterium flavescens]|uniref:NYN domain-containing protein n=1 Tax=Corynebacterium flavescens TaxID=28028 RepID=UPI00264A40A0|nr:NYN domain-containing protein [Corynebacterium flavescens]MDN6552633.1 NYN domain-containing protein [Corynebacterium flavescens]MDN6646915.1 NYN domain-containing protein [Corynebacterium flavescens]MDN6688326.1 NYN domain-containing protein [Corynebacterium flavescens]